MEITIALASGIECVVEIKLRIKLLKDNFFSRSISIKLKFSTLLNSFNLFSISSFANFVA